MSVLDYSRSFVTFFTKPHQGGNIARIQVDATCSVDGWEPASAAVTFHLIAPCRSEHMYRDGQLFQLPNYEFSGIFTEEESLILRTHWTSDEEHPEYARVTDRFERVAIDRLPLRAESLQSVDEVVAATLANRALVAQTTLHDDSTGATAVLEYPIKTMNVTREPQQLQVDTGPVIVPLFDSTSEHPIERFAVAHIVYCDLNRAEFILRTPHVVGECEGQPVRVTDYSEICFSSAAHTIWGEVV